MTEALFTEEKHAANCNTEKLRQIEELIKLETRSQIFDEMENDRYLADRYTERNNPTLISDKTQTSILPEVKKVSLMGRAKDLPEVTGKKSRSYNKNGCQKEADVKYGNKAANY